jgi:hypothetical protein
MPLQKFELITRYFRTFDYTKLDVRDESDLLKTFQRLKSSLITYKGCLSSSILQGLI